MHWQDIIFAIGQWIFVIALLPSVFGHDKPALSSCLVTGTVLGIFGFAYFSLGLVASGISACAVSGTWLILAWQQFRRRKS